MPDIHSGFQNVDATAQERAFFEFLDAAAALPSIIRIREEMRARHGPLPGARLLDAGCGVGHQVLALAPEIGPGGLACGLDLSTSLIAEARRRAQTQSLTTQTRFEVADITQPDGLSAWALPEFDVVRVERVLMYLPSPLPVIDRLVQALAPGGHLVVFEFDYLGAFVDHPDAARTHAWMQRVSTSVPSPMIGRQLPRLMREMGLSEVIARPQTVMTPLPMFRKVVQGTLDALCQAGEMTRTELDAWWQELEVLDAQGLFFAGFPGFVVSARRVGGA